MTRRPSSFLRRNPFDITALSRCLCADNFPCPVSWFLTLLPCDGALVSLRRCCCVKVCPCQYPAAVVREAVASLACAVGFPDDVVLCFPTTPVVNNLSESPSLSWSYTKLVSAVYVINDIQSGPPCVILTAR
jgi:hypothetical protein